MTPINQKVFKSDLELSKDNLWLTLSTEQTNQNGRSANLDKQLLLDPKASQRLSITVFKVNGKSNISFHFMMLRQKKDFLNVSVIKEHSLSLESQPKKQLYSKFVFKSLQVSYIFLCHMPFML